MIKHFYLTDTDWAGILLKKTTKNYSLWNIIGLPNRLGLYNKLTESRSRSKKPTLVYNEPPDGEDPVLEDWEMWSNVSLALLSGLL